MSILDVLIAVALFTLTYFVVVRLMNAQK
jgi:hypothetical protein